MNESLYDVIVVGGGPAGLTAAIYLARAQYRVLVIEKDTFGGQITITGEVVNYPGVGKLSGKELTATMQRQGESFGAEYLKANVTGLDLEGDIRTVHTDKGEYTCFGVLIATGAHPRMVGFPGEKEFCGHGVAYCATCDGEFFTGKEVFVIGGSFAAAEESVFLTKYARHVTVLIRGDDFSCAAATAQETRNHPRITVLTNTEVVKVEGDTQLKSITYRNKLSGQETTFAPEHDTFGVFVFAGYAPSSELVKEKLALTPQGYIETDKTQKTSIDGVYAAGDICLKNLRQVVTATGDGATAATELEKYAAAMQKKTGLVPKIQVVKEEKEPAVQNKTGETGLFTADMLTQLNTVFGKMNSSLILELYLDSKPSSVELENFMTELAGLTPKLTVQKAAQMEDVLCPFVKVLQADGTATGIGFHGIPGGHEFTSFILGLYNVSGPGQPVEDAIRNEIKAIQEPIDFKILVSLSCTMCPELVIAAQRMASLNPNITAEAYDLNHFSGLKDKYQVMSVPCLVITKDGEETIAFGKKNMEQLVEMVR